MGALTTLTTTRNLAFKSAGVGKMRNEAVFAFGMSTKPAPSLRCH